MKRSRLTILVGLYIILTGIPAPRIQGCGFVGIYTWLQNGNERPLVLSLPSIEFYNQLSLITGVEHIPVSYGRNNQNGRTLDADLSDLRRALSDSGAVEAVISSTVGAYQQWREAMAPKLAGLRDPITGALINQESAPGEPVAPPSMDLLSRLPTEFVLYAEGAALWHAGHRDEAETRWKAILELPANERRYKSIWAAYMLGLAAMKSSLDDACPWFEKTRLFAQEGHPDTLGLATEALGWMARAEWKRGKLEKALQNYLEQYRTGGSEQRRSAGMSIRLILTEPVFEADAPDSSLLEDPVARQVVTALILARSAYSKTPKLWLEALGEYDDAVLDHQAERLAWAFYQSGDINSARHWLEKAEQLSGDGQWVKSKIFLRDGRIDEALELLRQIAPTFQVTNVAYSFSNYWVSGFPNSGGLPNPKIQREIATLLVGRKEYVEAMDIFLRNGEWLDGAYLAERILTMEELEKYIQSLAAKPLPNDRMNDLRDLVFRRYVRADQLAKADVYCPEDRRKLFDMYRDLLTHARYRATSLYDAGKTWFEFAVITRTWGMELMGTEIEPDWTCDEGWYDQEGASQYRLSKPSASEQTDPLTAALSATDDEKRRFAENAPTPDRRFHYRWIAADDAWMAAMLLPDNSPLLAQALYWGGVWIKNRDDAGADRFYQELVRRCAEMPIGAEADRVRWFPKTPPEEVVPVPTPHGVR